MSGEINIAPQVDTRRGARELDDLALLATGLLAVPIGWLLLGWRWPACVSGYDAWATALPLLKALGEAGGGWHALAYRPDLLGGVRLRDAVGPNPLVALLARTGLTATGVYDLAVFALQALLGFLGARAAEDLARAWAPAGGARASGPFRVAAIVSCAFAPFLGWRVGYGHLALTTGLLPFAAALALVAAAAAGRSGITLSLVAGLAAVNGLLFTGHQLLLYAALFGAPVLAGLWFSARVPARRLCVPAAVLGLALLVALPALSAVIAHGLSADSPRAPRGMRITYSYLTAAPLDWVTSVPWTRSAIPAGRPALQHHESNVPLGPLLAFLALVPWRRWRALAWGCGAAVALVLAFSLDLRPVSTALIAAVPPLGSFRVPTRAALPLLLALTPLAVAAVRARTLERTGEAVAHAWALGVAGFVLLLALPPIARELVAWGAAGAVAMALRRGHGEATPAAGRKAAPVAAALLALAGGALGAFGERLLRPFADTDRLLAHAASLGERVRGARPELFSPLVRVSIEEEWPEFGPNTAFAAGLSSLDGYFFPPRRLLALVSALREQPYNPSGFVLRMDPERSSDRVLLQLYDVAWRVRRVEGRAAPAPTAPEAVPAATARAPAAIEVTPLPATAGAAWFAAEVRHVESLRELAAALRAQGDALHARARETAWVDASDPDAAGLPLPSPSCREARVRSMEASRQGEIALGVDTSAACPLVVAATYSAALQARSRTPEGWLPARTFPAYGALLGIWVPATATEVAVAP
jgi:hypothetical protein